MKGEEEEEWGVFGRPYPGAGGQDGSVALAQLYLVDHGMFIYLTPFSLQKIPAFSLPFYFFFPTTLLKAKNNPKIIQRVFEGWKEAKQFGQPSCLDTYSNQMFIPLISCGGERNFAGTLCVPPTLEVPGRRLRHFVLLGVFFFSFLWELCQLAGSRESLFPWELPCWIRELGEGQANWFQKIEFLFGKRQLEVEAAPAWWWGMPCHPASLPYPAFSLSCRGLRSWEEAVAIGWHRGDTPGLPTEPWSGGLGDVPPWWGVQGEIEGFLGCPELGAWWFSAPSFWSSVVSAFGSPVVRSSEVVWLQFSPSSDLGGCPLSFLPEFSNWGCPPLVSPSSELRVCLLPVCSQFGTHWLLCSPQIQVLVFVCPCFSPSLELGAFPPSALPQFGDRWLPTLREFAV